jgi:hypothetical protein
MRHGRRNRTSTHTKSGSKKESTRKRTRRSLTTSLLFQKAAPQGDSMTKPCPEEIRTIIDCLNEKYGNLSFGEPLIVNGKSYEAGFPVFLTDGDDIFILPYGKTSTKIISVPIGSIFG